MTSTLPNVYLLHGDLTDAEMNALYNHPKIKAMYSLTKAEGFGILYVKGKKVAPVFVPIEKDGSFMVEGKTYG